jgi:hypothetical protein
MPEVSFGVAFRRPGLDPLIDEPDMLVQQPRQERRKADPPDLAPDSAG